MYIFPLIKELDRVLNSDELIFTSVEVIWKYSKGTSINDIGFYDPLWGDVYSPDYNSYRGLWTYNLIHFTRLVIGSLVHFKHFLDLLWFWFCWSGVTAANAVPIAKPFILFEYVAKITGHF